MDIKITCCRQGTKWNPNDGCKGEFIKEFNSSEELVKFFIENKSWVKFPCILKDLNKNQMHIFLCKLKSKEKIIMGKEQFLDNLFEQGAKESLEFERGKQFNYKLFDCSTGFYFDKSLVAEGICEIVYREYDKAEDCDIITIRDVNTNKIYEQNQFLIKLVEIK